jgi:type I restriction enzyme, S subunit
MSPDALAIEELPTTTGPWRLPTSWVWAPLGLLTSVISRGRAPSYVSSGGVSVLNQRCVRWDKIDFGYAKQTSESSFHKYPDQLVVQDGDILWNSTGSGTIGRATIYRHSEAVNGPVLIDTHISIVRCTHCLPEYVSRFLSTLHVQKIISDLNVGSTNQLELPRAVIAELKIPLPPLPEQRRIVARIDELFAEITEGDAALRRARQGLATWRRALLKAAVTGELTRDWRETNRPTETGAELLARLLSKRRETWERREFARLSARRKELGGDRWKTRYPEPVGPEIADAIELPDAWAWASVDQLTCGDRTLAYGVLQPGPDIRGGVPLVRVGDINNGRVTRSNLKCISPVIAKEYSRTQLSGGELLMTLVGAIGRTAVAPPELAGANTARAVGMVPLSDLVNADWVELWFRSPAKQIEMVGKAHEVARKTLNLEDVRRAGVAIPPRLEQDRIVVIVTDLLATFDLEETAFELALREARALRQSILKAAFEGRLVSQEPTDEPASVLLARLRNGHSEVGRRRGRARATPDFPHPSLPGLTQSADPRVEPAGDE